MDFLSKRPFFFLLPPRFFEKTPVPSLTVSPTVSSSAQPYARTDMPLRIAHSASSKFLPSPFTFTRKLLILSALYVKKMLFFAFTGEGNWGETFTRKSLFLSLLHPYGEEVKAKNEKQRTRARWGSEVGGWCTFEKGFPVVDASHQMSDEPYF